MHILALSINIHPEKRLKTHTAHSQLAFIDKWHTQTHTCTVPLAILSITQSYGSYTVPSRATTDSSP